MAVSHRGTDSAGNTADQAFWASRTSRALASRASRSASPRGAVHCHWRRSPATAQAGIAIAMAMAMAECGGDSWWCRSVIWRLPRRRRLSSGPGTLLAKRRLWQKRAKTAARRASEIQTEEEEEEEGVDGVDGVDGVEAEDEDRVVDRLWTVPEHRGRGAIVEEGVGK